MRNLAVQGIERLLEQRGSSIRLSLMQLNSSKVSEHLGEFLALRSSLLQNDARLIIDVFRLRKVPFVSQPICKIIQSPGDNNTARRKLLFDSQSSAVAFLCLGQVTTGLLYAAQIT